MRLQDDIDFTTLTWVKQELDDTLKQAQQALEAYVEDTSDKSQMRFCASYLHQVQGTLRMVELYGAAMVVEEMERLAIGLLDGQIKQADDAYSVLMRGMVQLPDYLERLQSGHRDIPIVLLPLLNDLRACRGEKLLSETALFSPDLHVELPASAAGAKAPLAHAVIAANTQKLRLAFQFGLLKWFKGEDVDGNLTRLIAILDRVRSLTHQTDARRLWWIGAGALEAVLVKGLESSVALKLLVGRVDRELKRLIDSGEPAFASAPPSDVSKGLLYYVAQSTAASQRVLELREVYKLDRLMPSEAELEHARGALSGHNRALLDTVGTAIKDDLLRVKDALDLFLRTGSGNVDELAPQADALHRVGDTLGMLGLGVPRRVVLDQKEVLERIVAGRQPPEENALLDIAGSLLYVESSLDDHIERLGAEQERESVPSSGFELPQAEVRKILEATTKEAADNIQQAKQDIVAFIESPWDHSKIEQIPRLLEEISGALRMMNLPEAAELMQGVVRFTEVELLKHRRVPSGEQLDLLADAIASIEFYLEAVKEGRRNRDRILQVTRESLEALGYWPLRGDEALVQAEPETAPAATDVTGETFPTFAEDFSTERVEIPVAEVAADASVQLPEEPAPLALAPETVSDSLTELSFDLSTLEDAGAVESHAEPVGAPVEESISPVAVEIAPGEGLESLVIGEPAAEALAPSVQDLAGLDLSAEAAPAVAAEAEELATSEVPVASEAILEEAPAAEVPAAEPAELELPETPVEEAPIAEAAAVEAPVAEAPVSEAPVAETPVPEVQAPAASVEPPAPPTPVAPPGIQLPDVGFHSVPSDEIDDEIREVFVEEVQDELDNLNRQYPLWKHDLGDFEKLKPVRRSFHTLKGSGRLVGALAIGEYAWKIENMLNRVLDKTIQPTPAVLDLLDNAIDALPGMLAALKGEGQPSANIGFIMWVADQLASGQEAWLPKSSPAPAATAEAEPVSEAGSAATVDSEGLVAMTTAVEEVVADDVMAEATLAEESVAEESITEESITEESITEESITEESITEEPVAEEPVAEEPVAEETVAEETVAEEPVAEEPVAEEPVAEESVAEEPVAEESVAEESVAEETVAEETVAEEPVAEEPVAEEPVAEETIAEEPVAEETVAEETVAEEPVAEETVAEEPVAEEPVAEEPVAEEPVAEEPVAEETIAEETVAEEPVAEEPVAEETIAEETISEGPGPESLLSADPTLLEILSSEVSGHLTTIRDYLDRCAAAGAQPVSEEVLRAVHTMNGALSMVDLPALTRVVAPLEGYLKRLRARAVEPTAEGVAAIADSARVIAEAMTLLDDPERFPDTALLAERVLALRDELPPPDHPYQGFGIQDVDEHRVDEAQVLAEGESGAPEAEDLLVEEVEWAALYDADEGNEPTGGAPGEEAAGGLTSVPEAEVETSGEATIAGAADLADREQQDGEVFAVSSPEHEPEPDALEAGGAADFESLGLSEEAAAIATEEAGATAAAAAIDDIEGLFEPAQPEATVSAADEPLDHAREDAGEAIAAVDDESLAEFSDIDSFLPTDAELEGAGDLEALLPGRIETEATDDAELFAQLEAEAAAEGSPTATESDWGPEFVAEPVNLPEDAEAVDTESSPVEAEALAVAETPAEAAVEARSAAGPADIDPEGPLDLPDLDLDLLDIFVEESVDLLDHADSMMVRLREAPEDLEPVGALQRDLHTLKGGARMAGLAPIGDLSHSMESLFESVAKGDRTMDRPALEALERAFDRLHGMVQRVRARQAIAMPLHSIARIEAILDGRQYEADLPAVVPGAVDAAPRPESTEQAAKGDEARAEPVAAAPPPAAPRVVQRRTQLDEDEAAARAAQQELIRVRADLLDNLVNFAGEVSIYRSRLEAQMGGFRFNLVEFEQTVNRLRDQLRKLEIETEAQILSRFQREADASGNAEFDPLELDRFSTLQQLSRALAESVSDLVSIQNLLDDIARQSETLLLQQSRVSSDLQEGLMRTRMVPFESLVPRLRRIMRQTSAELGKKAQLKVEGTQGEMDRTVLERMTAPFEHMLRNSLAHGIEPPEIRRARGKPEEGTVSIKVSREATEVLIQVVDDGGGMNRDAIRQKAIERGLMNPEAQLSDRDIYQFVLESGFSTASEVSKIAGRGVGMDVVASEVKQLGGSLEIDSTPGLGTTFTIRLPFTLAVAQAVLVKLGEATYAIPMTSITGVTRLQRKDYDRRIEQQQLDVSYGGETYQIYDLGDLLRSPVNYSPDETQVPLLMSKTGDQRAAVRVSQVLGSKEVVVKSVGAQLSAVPGIFGATILGDGRVVVILDLAPLVRHGVALRQAPELAAELELLEAPPEPTPRRLPLVMVVDDSITMRKVTTRVLERSNLEVFTAKDGLDAVEQLQDRIPDVILLDIEMPRMDGYEVATYIRNDPRLKHIPIIMITSRTGEKHRQRALEVGVDRYLGKPYQEADLLKNVQDALEAGHVHVN
jgi:chemosensory pili system protein ChpA (sensor histidine kinase/response regulator)